MVCPKCREGTRAPRGDEPERCIDPDCPVDWIVRNNRGEPWARGYRNELIHKPNRHPLPVDTEPGRAIPQYEANLPTPDASHDDALLARAFGTIGMSVRTKEARK